MKLFAGMDISMNKTAICVMDDVGNAEFEGTALSIPEDLSAMIAVQLGDN